MKKINLIIQLTAAMLVLFSCKKDATEANSGSSITGSLTVKVQGTLWTAASSSGYYDVGKNVSTMMASSTYTSENITIVFSGRGIGTYKFGSYGSSNVMSLTIGGSSFQTNLCDNPDGEIVISKYDEAKKKMSGTFKFQGKSMVDHKDYTITEGKFDDISLTLI
jgi:hypothetical protein